MESDYPKLTLNKLSYEDIKVGDEFSFERFIDAGTLESFAKLSGDWNPLHMDETYARATKFGGRVAHGMLMGSFFSALVGMLCPGLKCLYLSQEIRFRNPLLVSQPVVVFGRVINKSDAAKILTIQTLVKDKNEKVLVEGEAKVQVQNE